MGAKLHIQPENGEPFEVPIRGTATIGRTRENTVWLRNNTQVSRQHAVIRCYGSDQFQLIDLGSVNGVHVDDVRMVVPVMLKDGTRIRIADDVLTFHLEVSQEVDLQDYPTVVGSMVMARAEDTPVALLVCDIREFSAISEKLPSADLAQVLGVWLRDAAKIVERVGGTLDKFIGDALLSYWGNTTNAKLNCGAAYSAAKQMRELARERKWPDGTPFNIAIAVHYGPVSCSNVGLSAERDTTIIGDAVNTTFRLVGAAKDLDEAMLLSSDFIGHVPGVASFRDLGERALKGKHQLVRIFGLPQ